MGHIQKYYSFDEYLCVLIVIISWVYSFLQLYADQAWPGYHGLLVSLGDNASDGITHSEINDVPETP